MRNTTTGVLVALVLAALAIAFLRPTSESSVHDTGPPLDIDSATVEAPLVVSKFADGGFSAFGITFSSPTYRIAVSFAAPAECAEALARSATWPVAEANCGPTGGISGELSGSGRTSTGDTIVAVGFEVTEECFDGITVGDVWKPTADC